MNTLKILTAAAGLLVVAGAAHSQVVHTTPQPFIPHDAKAQPVPAQDYEIEPNEPAQTTPATATIYGIAMCAFREQDMRMLAQGASNCDVISIWDSLSACEHEIALHPNMYTRRYFKSSCVQKTVPTWEAAR